MARIRWSAVNGVLASSMTNVATTIESPGLTDLPDIGGGDTAAIILDPLGVSGRPEIAYITAHVLGEDTATIARGQETSTGGSTARAHASGIAWRHGPTPADFASDAAGSAAIPWDPSNLHGGITDFGDLQSALAGAAYGSMVALYGDLDVPDGVALDMRGGGFVGAIQEAEMGTMATFGEGATLLDPNVVLARYLVTLVSESSDPVLDISTNGEIVLTNGCAMIGGNGAAFTDISYSGANTARIILRNSYLMPRSEFGISGTDYAAVSISGTPGLVAVVAQWGCPVIRPGMIRGNGSASLTISTPAHILSFDQPDLADGLLLGTREIPSSATFTNGRSEWLKLLPPFLSSGGNEFVDGEDVGGSPGPSLRFADSGETVQLYGGSTNWLSAPMTPGVPPADQEVATIPAAYLADKMPNLFGEEIDNLGSGAKLRASINYVGDDIKTGPETPTYSGLVISSSEWDPA